MSNKFLKPKCLISFKISNFEKQMSYQFCTNTFMNPRKSWIGLNFIGHKIESFNFKDLSDIGAY